LDHTETTDLAMAQVINMEQLEYLNIVSTNITVVGMKGLLKLPNLKMLYLQGTKISPQDRLEMETISKKVKLNFGDSMKSAVTDTIFLKKTT